MARDKLQEARERYKDAVDAMRDNWARMREDLAFSNPTDPRQWPDDAEKLRKDAGRPCYTFDRTNQFISQVVNDWRSNKPASVILPVDSGADKWTAQVLGGLVKHIEYTSRADQARDTAIEHSARIGLGWTRIVPEVVRPETNEQEIILKRIHDPFSVVLDAGSVDPDGQDAMHGFVTTRWRKDKFKRAFPKAKTPGNDGWPTEHAELWADDDGVTICEYFYIKESPAKYVRIHLPDGSLKAIKADEFQKVEAELGFRPLVVGAEYEIQERTQTWCKMTGAETLEETVFPCRWVPLIPYYGDELWVDGKRHLSGLVRKLIPAQRAYNMERSAGIEFVALQPKAPFTAPFEAIDGHEEHWEKLNTGSPSLLPWNHVDSQGKPIPKPSREMPPQMPASYATLGQLASNDMEAAVGMFKANLGQSGNETSGRAINARQREGDQATFHYADNGMRSVAHETRIILDMIPRVYDTARTARIIGEDGKNEFVQMKPGIGKAQREGKKTLAIDPTAGQYDVRVTAGASHATQREEAAFGLEQLLQSAPQLAPALAPALLKLRDFPDAEKYSRAVMAMVPPEVKAAMEDEEEEQPIPPQAQAMIEKLQAENQQMAAMLDAAESEMAKVETERQKAANDTARVEIDREIAMLDKQLQAEQITVAQYQAETARLKVIADQESRDMDRERSLQEKAEKESEKSDEVKEKANLDSAFAQIAQALQMLAEQQAGTNETLAAVVDATQRVQSGIEALTETMKAPRQKQASAEKVNGKWVLSSTETYQ